MTRAIVIPVLPPSPQPTASISAESAPISAAVLRPFNRNASASPGTPLRWLTACTPRYVPQQWWSRLTRDDQYGQAQVQDELREYGEHERAHHGHSDGKADRSFRPAFGTRFRHS